MKKNLLLFLGLCSLNAVAQDHFSGLKNSNKIGILSASTNPAELSNLGSKYDINVFSFSISSSNNKVGFKDLINSDSDLEELIFTGNEPINLRIDSEIYGPGFAMKLNKWAFGVTSKAYIKANFIDLDSQLGKAIIDGNDGNILSSVALKSDYNQRMNATTWGELGFTVARNIFENEKHKFNGGVALKLLFPGSYANFGIDKFQGNIDYAVTTAYLNDINTKLNIAYSGNLTGSFSDSDNYTKSVFGKLNGVAADFGVNYQFKDQDGYKVNAGMAVKNIGSMTFKDPENSSTNYAFVIPKGTLGNPGLDLSSFENVESLKEAETVLKNKGYLTTTKAESDIKVKLPTIFSAYADVKVVSKLYVSLYTQQKIGNDNDNDQITTQNVISVTPRFSLNNFEVYSPWAKNEISGTTGGFGLRLYGFYIGSSSIVTALTSDTKQADFYMGYRLGLR
ncbi:hypothetical protein SLW70_11535 [Flavobacterium sp. NG2]|uniref:hypothetical protein n=1 Tax=Flavobacterium sp. NG2 TaxID=3097547 RepID=UPI002A814430|nr:hypothetical protein [Flavobacterium sp. NG2]WPR70564.1 hypothetical protein SLW70_11535 [Flavobacterium sp. NG2]